MVSHSHRRGAGQIGISVEEYAAKVIPWSERKCRYALAGKLPPAYRYRLANEGLSL